MSKQTKKIFLNACLLMCLFGSPFSNMELFATSTYVRSTDQKREVRGIVKDSNGEPLIGVSIIAKENPSIGAVTDLDGVFVLSLPTSCKTLKVSYIGYKDVEVPVKEGKMLNNVSSI